MGCAVVKKAVVVLDMMEIHHIFPVIRFSIVQKILAIMIMIPLTASNNMRS